MTTITLDKLADADLSGYDAVALLGHDDGLSTDVWHRVRLVSAGFRGQPTPQENRTRPTLVVLADKADQATFDKVRAIVDDLVEAESNRKN